ncbi:probable long-chain-alcohol O-fatty-acyltransferase 5 [Rutidosis leptorrhynchoides]|uniref:probable long-chain-alcohol O-fatty-acyltransferase 5 n=1 Tax=Rutidosis leptorrhynchoides TaxID=125765 RepID=UPI003A9A2525
METIVKNFVIQISTITVSLTYCYFISSKLPKGIYRFISLIPIFYIFTILPLYCTSIFTTAITFSFTTWLTNFKLIRFAFDLEQSPYHRSISLLNFIIFTSLPIKSKRSSTSTKTPFLYKLGFQILIFSILVQTVLDYRIRAHQNIVFIIYCGLLFLIIDIVSAVVNALMFALIGLELEPSSNKPYMATSLQNFWGSWNLMVTNTLRYTVYKPVVTVFSNYKWAPLAGILASFLVSGLMHELFVYQLSREKATWEMTRFFVIHGICVVVEMMIKRSLAGRRWRLPDFVATVLTVGFVTVTGFWLFFPPLVRRRLDVKVLQEFTRLDFLHLLFNIYKFAIFSLYTI